MDMPFIVPQLHAHRATNRSEMLGGELGIPDGSNTFNRHTFVVLTAGSLAACATAAVSTCGLCLDASKLTTKVDPPTQFFGDRHFPVNPAAQRFAVSVTDSSGNFGQANGAPQLSSITIGQKYGLIKLSSGDHALNISDTTNGFFVVVEKISQWQGAPQTSATYNPVVIVELVSGTIQII